MIWLQIVMASPATYILKNYESLSIFSESQFEKQGVLNWKCLSLYVTRQLIWRKTPKLFITDIMPNCTITAYDNIRCTIPTAFQAKDSNTCSSMLFKCWKVTDYNAAVKSNYQIYKCCVIDFLLISNRSLVFPLSWRLVSMWYFNGKQKRVLLKKISIFAVTYLARFKVLSSAWQEIEKTNI